MKYSVIYLGNYLLVVIRLHFKYLSRELKNCAVKESEYKLCTYFIGVIFQQRED